jgi:hypothetical protein
MNDSDHDRTEAIHQIASILAGAFFRVRFPTSNAATLTNYVSPFTAVDCAETKRESCDSRLTQ